MRRAVPDHLLHGVVFAFACFFFCFVAYARARARARVCVCVCGVRVFMVSLCVPMCSFDEAGQEENPQVHAYS